MTDLNALKRDDNGDSALKTCNVCKLPKPRTEFYADRSRPDGLLYRCKGCHRAIESSPKTLARRRERSRERTDGKRWGWYIKRYGLTLDDWHRMIIGQSGRCASCGDPLIRGSRPVHIDHCHMTNVVRGLLCSACNTSEGLLRSSPTVILSLLEYVCDSLGEGVYECTLRNALNSLGATNR